MFRCPFVSQGLDAGVGGKNYPPKNMKLSHPATVSLEIWLDVLGKFFWDPNKVP